MYGLQGSVRPFDSTPLCVRSHVNEGVIVEGWACLSVGRLKGCTELARARGSRLKARPGLPVSPCGHV